MAARPVNRPVKPGPVTAVVQVADMFEALTAHRPYKESLSVEQAVDAARKMEGDDFSVTGHTDRAGPAEYNMLLSLRRADAVREALATRGIAAGRISVAGRGEAEPAVPTADGVAEPANRRVEIIVLR